MMSTIHPCCSQKKAAVFRIILCVSPLQFSPPTLHLVDATELGTSAGNTMVSMVDRFGGLPVATALGGSGLQTKLAKVTVFQAHLGLEGLVFRCRCLVVAAHKSNDFATQITPKRNTHNAPNTNNKKNMPQTQKIC